MSDDALFDVPELAAPDPAVTGRAEAALQRALEQGAEDGTNGVHDAALAAAALVAARALDAIDRNPSGKSAYAVAALLTPYREALHQLRLPAEIAPAGARLPEKGPTDPAEWLRDALGTPE